MRKTRSNMDPRMLTQSTTVARASVVPPNTVTWSSVLCSRRKLPQLPRSVEQTSELAATQARLTEHTAGIVTSVQTLVTPVMSSSTPHYTTVGSRPLPVWAATGIPTSADTPQHSNCVGSTVPTILTADNISVDPTGTVAFKQPPGFKELRERVSKFAGDGKEDFEVWLTDYCEAMGDCG